jgi:glutathione S-transferase
MTQLTLVIGNKNYSSWSLRAWLVLKQANLKFEEIIIPLCVAETHEKILQHSPSAKVPLLYHDDLKIWESLAICEYVTEQFEPSFLPKDVKKRALARSISNEVHAGFRDLRSNMPLNCRASYPGKGMTPDVQNDIDRISEIWRDCRQNYGQEGDFLFGHFTIADAMYAPLVLHLRTYGVKLGAIEQAYADAILGLPAIQLWLADAEKEKEKIEEIDLLL